MAKTRDQFVTIIADALGKSQNATAISGSLLGTRCIDFLDWAHLRIGRAYSFNELNAVSDSVVATVADIKTYPMVTGTNNLGLTRPKDIESIIILDSQNSRKLRRWGVRRFDTQYPRPENYASGKPSIYIRHGMNVSLHRIPDAAYDLLIRYPQWAEAMTSSSQSSSYENKDDLIIAGAILEGYLHFEEYNDAAIWAERFKGLLHECIMAEGNMDWEPEAVPMTKAGFESGEPWIDPFGTSDDPLHNFPS